MKKISILLFFLTISKTFSETIESDPYISATTKGEPSAIVGGLVNAITGDLFFAKDDLIVQGKEKIHIPRIYISRNRKKISSGWQNLNDLIAFNIRDRIIIPEKDGISLSYKIPDRKIKQEKEGGMFETRKHKEKRRKKNKEIKKYNYAFYPLELEKSSYIAGITNCSSGVISGKLNLKNIQATICGKFDNLFVTSPDGSWRHYKRAKNRDVIYNKIFNISISEKTAQYISHYSTAYLLKEEILPNGNKIFYQYDKKERLSTIKATDPTCKKTFSWAKFSWTKNHRGHSLVIKTSDGKELSYLVGKKYSQLIKIVKSPEHPHEILEYRKHKKDKNILVRIVKPEGRQTYIKYYDKGKNSVGGQICHIPNRDDNRFMRVAWIEKSVGNDQSSHCIYKFIYHPGKIKEIGGYTEVYDVYDNKTEYHYSPYLRLEEIRRYKKENNRQILLNIEKFVWGKEGGDQATFLLGKGLLDSKRKAIFFRTYEYDDLGNVVLETIYGNLSGVGKPIALTSSGLPDKKVSEKFEIRRTFYKDNTNRLKTKKDSSGKGVEYEYLDKTDLPIKKFITFKDKIVFRHFYVYDTRNILRYEVRDDGSSKSRYDFKDVTCRKITIIDPKEEEPGAGLPQTILENYVDLKTKRIKLLTKKHIVYKKCLPVEEHIFDENGRHRYTTYKKYDHRAKLIEEINRSSQKKTIKYNRNDYPISIEEFSGRVTKNLKYDFENRLIKEEKIGNDGISHKTTFQYDLKSNLTKKTNFQGNSIKYCYNSLGNLTKTTYPKIISKSSVKNPEIVAIHDDTGRKIKEIDPNKNETQFSYNAYKKITKIIYPDNTTKENIYNLDGTLKYSINQEGTKTEYEYDFLNRITCKKIVSKDGKLLSEEKNLYKGLNLISKRDPEGNVTKYEYDDAGRKTKEILNDRIKKEFFYDPLSRIERIKVHCMENSHFIIYKRDVEDRIISERKEDNFGKLLFKKDYKYDSLGNRSVITTYIDNKIAKEKFLYDSSNRLIKKIDPLGFITSFKYIENHKNSLGQKVIKKYQIDPTGLQTISTLDALGQERLIEKISKRGILLTKERKEFDLSKNLIKHSSYKIKGGRIDIHFFYNSMNRIIKQIEADGKIKTFSYTKSGKPFKTVTPNRITLERAYDDLGRMTSLKSSDNSCHYTFKYNRLNLITKTTDLIKNRETLILRDREGRVIEETLANGLTIKKAYDPLGRKEALTLPDNSKIKYSYYPISLKEISRIDRDGFKLYSHRFKRYDLSNNLLEEDPIFNLGNIKNSFDLLGRKIKISSPYLLQEILEFDPAGNIKNLSINGEKTTYSYDDLHQLTEETGLFNNSYEYDEMNNRIQKDNTSYLMNDLNQLIYEADIKYSYDNNGNLISKGSNTKYRYDALDRLIEIISSNKKITLSYDALNRRVERSEYELSGEKYKKISHQKFLYDEKEEIGIFENDIPICLRVLKDNSKAEIGSAISIELKDKTYLPINDIFGNISSLVDTTSSEIEESYSYDSFGKEKIYNAIGDEIENSALNNPWRYLSKYTDEGLVFFGRRHYDPNIGRWISCDPKEFEEGLNLYLFVLNNPLIIFDLYGLESDLPPFNEYNRIRSSAPHIDLLEGDRFEDAVRYLAEMLIRETDSHLFDVGKKELKNKILMYINGIATPYKEAKRHAEYISKILGGVKIKSVYNATHTVILDLMECGMGKVGCATAPVKLFKDTIVSYLSESSKNSALIIGHSQGAIHTLNMLKSIDKGFRERIDVLTVAGGSIIDKKWCGNAINLISNRDFVPYLNPKAWSNSDCIRRLNPHKDAPFFDHGFMSPTYIEEIEKFGEKYINKPLINYKLE